MSTSRMMETDQLQDRLPGPISVLFVCAANVCRSPACQAVMERMLARRGLADQFRVDSAGVLDDLIGHRPPWRTRWAAFVSGYRIRGRSRRVTRQDLNRFDWVIAMDRMVVMELRKLTQTPRAEVRLLTDFLPDAADPDVIDPMFRPWSATWSVLRQFEEACPRIIDALLELSPRP